MTQYLETLEVGDAIEVSGPFGLIHYCGNGNFYSLLFGISQCLLLHTVIYLGIIEVKNDQTTNLKASTINMICGGSGLTPMFQLLKYILSSGDKTKIAMVFANNVSSYLPYTPVKSKQISLMWFNVT